MRGTQVRHFTEIAIVRVEMVRDAHARHVQVIYPPEVVADALVFGVLLSVKYLALPRC
jgi:hypothetical protein